MATTELPPTTTASRLRSVQQSTGLSAAQLGVARLYPQVHRSHGSVSGSLSGEEILVKDLQQVAGEIRSSGSPAHGEVCADNDAAVMSLLSQGAELVGASVTAEFGATVYTEPELIGGDPGPVNPIDARMTSGGSSSGAAVAVARGIARIAHANDGGGSIRIPAAAVGLPGFKPAHQVMRVGQQLPNPAAQGFIASSLSLTTRAYGLTGDRTDVPSGIPANDIRLGMTTVPFHGDASQAGPTTVDPRICAATTAAAALLVSHPQVSGVTPISRPYPIERFSAFSRIMAARCVSLPDPLGPLPAWLKARGASLTAADIASATDCVSGLPTEVLSAWSDVDVVITPTLACAPPPVGAFSDLAVAGAPRLDFLAQTAWTPWATLWNLTGWAALSVPLVPAGAGQWPVSVHLGAVDDRVDATTQLELGEFLQTSVQELIDADAATQDAFVLTEPGDIEALGYRPVALGHRHGRHHSHDHNHCHDQDRHLDREDQ